MILDKLAASWIIQLETYWVVSPIIQWIEFLWPETVRTYFWLVLIVALLMGLGRGWPKRSVKSKISGTDAVIEIKVCDMFDQKSVYVVSSNATFDTGIEDGTISTHSIQGQYTKRFCDSIPDLNQQLDDSLAEVKSNEISEQEKPYGKRKEYPLGTVAKVTCKGKCAYFVALACLDKNGVANATTEQILGALPTLWEYVRSRGNLEPITMPIIGSGLSGTTATREELIREISKSFIAAARKGRFCEHFTIAISPEDFRKKDIDLQKLGRFLERECFDD